MGVSMGLPKHWPRVAGGALNESGQAWVYEVSRRGEAGRSYALKRLKNPARRERFRREVETMARLADHALPVPPIVDQDLAIERPWFVMPWYTEGSLQKFVGPEAEALGVKDGIDLVRDVAAALRALHERGYAHRDVKPSNILLDGRKPLLADFGLCLKIEESVRLTAPAEAIGSRLYIAPENESGIADGIDQRPADFYAWAKFAWAILAATNPPAREAQIERRYRIESVTGVPLLVGLNELFAQLLDTDPRARLADWSVVLHELDTISKMLSGASELPAHQDRQDLAEALAVASRLAERRSADARRAEADRTRRLRARVDDIGTMMHRSLDELLHGDLMRLSEASGGELGIDVSSAGSPMSQLIDSGDVDFLQDRKVEPFSLAANSPALVAIAWRSAPGSHLDSHVYLGIYLIADGDRVSFVRLPVIYGRGEQAIRVRELIPGTIAEDGPYPLELASAEAAALAFTQATAVVGRRLVTRFMEFVDADSDPFDLDHW
ncbi:serine/threonine protein kinase [Jiangella alba]|uniref:Serine/threonine protein kinase n=1 Tax=Jiangella alba TaxID=561176 RepID=A0A1H5PKK4_9ACTN|nr:protein kinase [Jiangella alba]SEF14413.1 Serine/threonine protein kinase [Jiangella alba]